MGTVNDRVTALVAAVGEYNEDVNAAIAALRSDVDALQGAVTAGREASEELARVDASLTDLESKVAAGVSTVGDADADGVPAAPAPLPEPVPSPEPTPEPTPEEPVV